MHILITGARAPVALDLTRRFGQAGHRVTVADSVPCGLAGFSRYASASWRLPPPRQRFDDFRTALDRQVRQSGVELIVPTCEEVLWVTRARPPAAVFAPSFEQLVDLHSKWNFQQTALRLGLKVPESWLLSSESEARTVFASQPRLVFKPVFSRFGTETRIGDPPATILPGRPWVAQRFLAGRALCSYSVAARGVLRAHACYEPVTRLNGGAAVIFRAVEHPGVWDWVKSFVSQLELSGQLSFDFIESEGEVAAIECNPRATSGLHLLGPELAEAFTDKSGPCCQPVPGKSAMLTFPALWASSRALFAGALPVVESWRDPLPTVGQALSFLPMVYRAWRLGIGLLQATTHDIEWDGQP